MEKRNRNILLFLVGAVIVAAVFSSFGLPFFTGGTPEIVLPAPQPVTSHVPGEWGENEGTLVAVTPQTVQSVIAALDRAESYSRTVTTALNGAAVTAQVWTDGDWTRTDLTLTGGGLVHTIVGEGTVWRWYGNESRAVSWPGDDASRDLEGQRIPTYEDVLELDRDSITNAGYEEVGGLPCVYVEAYVPELEQTERYWVSADTGLLEAAENEVDGTVVWSMTVSGTDIPAAPAADRFTLPDGTVLHEPSRPVLQMDAGAKAAD